MRNKPLLAAVVGVLAAIVVGFVLMVIDVIIEAINVG